jgi:hypothetical protein
MATHDYTTSLSGIDEFSDDQLCAVLRAAMVREGVTPLGTADNLLAHLRERLNRRKPAPPPARRGKGPASKDKAFKRFMQAATQPVPFEEEWHVGFLTRDLWEALPYEARKDLMFAVNAALADVAKKHCSGGA